MPVEAELFPSFICRVAGLPVNRLTNLRFNCTKLLLDEYFILHKRILDYSSSITDLIYNSITSIEDKKTRAKLLSLRRDLFNNRIDAGALKNILYIVDKELKDQLSELLETANKQQEVYGKLVQSYKAESKKIRQDFIGLLKNQEFQKGLLLSSNSLFSTQNIYMKIPECEKLNNKVEQLERGLLRYYTRMAMKATPFGTFCAILPGKLENNLNGRVSSFKGSMQDKRSILLINKGLFTGISQYLKQNEKIKKYINLELNPTIKSVSNQLVFLTEINEKEVFQRLLNNPVLDLLSREMIRLKKITYGNLVTYVVRNEQFDTTEEEVTPYIEKLIEIGFLKYNFGIPAQEVEWNKILIPFLDQINDDNAKKISSFLKAVQKNIDDFDKADAKSRYDILEKTTGLVNELTREYSLESNLVTDIPFYEDSTAECEIYLCEEKFRDVFKNLSSFIQITSKISSPRRENATMRKFFDGYYKDKSYEVMLLQFYEDFYREHFKEHLEKVQDRNKQVNIKEEDSKYNYSNPLNVDLIDHITAGWTKISELIIAKWENNSNKDEINFSYNDFHDALSNVPECRDTKSFSIFGQVVLPADGENYPRFIFPDGKYYIGYGKYYSRFLRLFTGSMQDQMFDTNNKISADIVAEICGDDNFNANLHPPLVQTEISYPTVEGGLAEYQIDCTNIIVEPDEQDQYSLRLKDKLNGKFINPIDLGFLNLLRRPPLFQLLANFTSPGNFSLNIPSSNKHAVRNNNKDTNSDNNRYEKIVPHPEISFRPRIVYENNIVLTRRSWFIPDELFPALSDKEEYADYFIRVNKWRIENNIPREIYVRINIIPNYPPPKDKATITGNNGKKTIQADEDSPLKEENTKNTNSTTKDGLQEKSEGIKDQQEVITEENKTEAGTNSQKTNQKMSRDYYKPQYIDFDNPLLVNLFGKMTVNLKKYTVHIEENYPEKDGLMNINDEFYATEQIFQINFPEKTLMLNKIVAEKFHDK